MKHRLWFSWGTSATLAFAGGATQPSTHSPGSSLMQVVEEPGRKGVLLDLVLTNKEVPFENIKAGSSQP